MHVFVNDIQQRPFGRNIPSSPEFFVCLTEEEDSLMFVSYSQVEEASHKHIAGEESLTPVE